MELSQTSLVPGPDELTDPRTSADGDAGSGLAVGDRLGRYTLLRSLGAGGMGEVFEGQDPRLDRRVAIKVLHLGRVRGDAEQGEQRLRREAKALASLSHPNVVQIFDVGRKDGRVWLAMELVHGETMAAWATRRRSLDELLAAFEEAGRGLSAAHAAGLVHRDFKLTNVMIDDRGRARVLDFGLSTAFESDVESITRMASGDPDPDMFTVGTGRRVGTPLYMSPEQLVGGTVDARTDQFGFCVSLFLALHGRYPEPVLSQSPRGVAVRLGDRPTVPTAIDRVLARGMAPHAEDRFGSMEELLAALGRARRPWHARTWLRGSMLAGVALGLAWLAAPAAPTPCARGQATVDEVWSKLRRDRLAAVWSDERTRGTRKVVLDRLDAWAERWAAAHREACESRADDPSQLDRRMECLEQRLATFDGTTETLAGQAEGTAPAVTVVADLPRPEGCLEPAVGGPAPVPDDPAVAADVAALRRDLARQRGVIDVGSFQAALDVLEPLLARAERTGFDPVIAEVLAVQAEATHGLHDIARTRELVERTYHLAVGSGHEHQAFFSASDLGFIIGVLEQDPAAAEPWFRQAEALLERGGRPAGWAAKLENDRGLLAYTRGEHQAAVEIFERAVASMRAAGQLGSRLGSTYNNIGVNLQLQGKLAPARDAYHRAIEQYRDSYGERHPIVAQILANLGAAQRRLGDLEGARASLELSIEISTEAVGPDNPVVYAPLVNLGNLDVQEGRTDDGISHLERARAVLEASRGPEHPSVAEPLDALGDALTAAGRLEEALQRYERALALLEPNPEATPHLRGHALMARGRTLRLLGRMEDAERSLRRSIEVLAAGDIDPAYIGEAKLELALTLEDEPEARTLIEQAIEALTGAEDQAEALERARRWQREHGGSG